MKAVRVHEFGGPESLRVETTDELRPAPEQVLVRIRAAGVNPVDTYIRAGMHSVRPSLPYTPGFDGAGVVADIGTEVRRLKHGTRVYLAGCLSGSYAEYALCHETQLHLLPERLTFAQGAAVGIPYATAYRALFQVGRVAPGETVLVRGASGAVGIAAVQLARAAGATVIGTAGTESGRALALEHGASHAFDHGSRELADALKRLTGAAGMDVILEMRADKNLGQDLQLLAPRGRVVVIGSRGPVEINPRDAMVREGAIHSVFILTAKPQELLSIHAALGAAFSAGVARPVVARELALEDAKEAHAMVLEPGGLGKIVLTP